MSESLKEFFLKQKEAAHQASRTVFSRIPRQHLGWRPAAGMLTLGEIVRHVWMSEEGIARIAAFSDWSYHQKRVPLGLAGILGEVTSLENELEQLARVNQLTLELAAQMPDERWQEERVNESFGFRRKVSVIFFGINEHHVHHRAQAGAYLHILTGEKASHYAL